MKSTAHVAITAPIKLHLEYREMTVGELSNILRHWQALLRVAWREAYELQHGRRAPKPRVFTVAASTGNSFDLISEYALPWILIASQILGSATDWHRQARIAYGYLSHIWKIKSGEYVEREPTLEEGFEGELAIRENTDVGEQQVTIIGGDKPAITFPSHILDQSETSGRLLQFWKIANSGDIAATMQEIHDTNDMEDRND